MKHFSKGLQALHTYAHFRVLRPLHLVTIQPDSKLHPPIKFYHRIQQY